MNKHEQFREQQYEAARKAMEHYNVIDLDMHGSTRYVQAEAKTGSRYAVVVTRMPEVAGRREGGGKDAVLVTCLAPFEVRPLVLPRLDPPDAWYFAQKWFPSRNVLSNSGPVLSMGDLAALMRTVHIAWGRDPGELEVLRDLNVPGALV